MRAPALACADGAPPGTRTPNPLIERQWCRHVPPSAPVLVRGDAAAPRSWSVFTRAARCRVVSGEFNGRLIVPCSARDEGKDGARATAP